MKIEGGQVRIADLINHGSATLAGLEAVGVTFVGPAIVTSQGATFTQCTWDTGGGGFEAILWEFDPAVRPALIGVIALAGCSFTDCTFLGVGLAGPPDVMQKMAENSTVKQ